MDTESLQSFNKINSKKFRVGLDIDGVLYPWHYSIYRYFTEFRGFEGDEREFWTWVRSQPPESFDYFVSIPTLYLNQMPTQDVLIYLPKVAEIADIYYITSRPNDLKWATRKFFNMYDLPFKENVIFSKEKANYVRLLNLQYFLDDLPQNVDSLQSLTKAYLFKAVHNWEVRDRYNTINSIKEFYELLDSEARNGKQENLYEGLHR